MNRPIRTGTTRALLGIAAYAFGGLMGNPRSALADAQEEAAPRPAATVPAAPSAQAAATRPDPAGPPDVEIEALVAALSSEDWKARQRAQEALVREGESVRGRLERAAREGADAEGVRRAKAALRAIDENRLAGTSLVTLHLKGVPAPRAFEEIGRQAGFVPAPEPAELWTARQWPAVTLDADREPFWTVFRKACEQTGIEPEMNAAPPAPAVPAGPPRGGVGGAGAAEPAPPGRRALSLRESQGDWIDFDRYVVSGPVALTVKDLTETRKVEYKKQPTPLRTLELTVQAMIEPKLRVLPGSGGVKIDLAVDDKGHSLLPADDPDGDGVMNGGGDAQHEWDLTASLTAPPDLGHKIARLKGTVHLTLATKLEMLEVPDPLSARDERPRTVGGRRFRVARTKKTGKTYQVQVVLYRDAMNDVEWQTYVQNNPCEGVRLVDDAGRVLASNRADSDADSNNRQMTITLMFDPQAAGEIPWGKLAKLTWEMPAETKTVALPFEFTDLPFPQ